jgi:hypothetical protein
MITKIITKNLHGASIFPYCLLWCDFWAISGTLERRDDLERLVAWATRKKLAGVKNYYKRLLTDTELLLADRNIRRPKLSFWSIQLYFAYRILFPPPSYYKKGAALRYRLRK